MGVENGNVRVNRVGDVIEVRLQDSSYHTYYKKKVSLNNQKQLKDLVNELREKGVQFPTIGWLD